VEIVPRSFSIVVSEGSKLNQLRFLKGVAPSSNRTLDKLAEQETLVYSEHDEAARPDIDEGLWIRVDLAANGASGIVGYKAKPQAPPVDLRKLSYYEPEEFWEPIYQPRSGQLILNPDDFYVLASKHRIRIPNTVAAAMVPYDPSVGEFRIHYAGFFDPGFGYGSNDLRGTRAVLEVRSHEVPFLMEDGQVVGRLIYERLLETPDKVYGKGIGSSYQSQGVALSKQFKPFRVHSAALGT
jgi:dCTP deaminase